MAVSAIGAHKLRSILTLVGIVAGVAAIIAVMTGVSVVQSQMEAELSVLGNRTFQIMKFPMGGFNNDRNINFREIARWPPLTMEHVYAIRERVDSVDLVGAELWHYNTRVSYRDSSTEPRLMVCGGTPEYPENNTHYVELGRNLTEEDVVIGRRVVVIGHGIAQELFPFIDPVGKTVKVDGHKFTVQGVFGEKKSAMGGQYDSYVLMPIIGVDRSLRDPRRGRPPAVDLHHRPLALWGASRGGPGGDAIGAARRARSQSPRPGHLPLVHLRLADPRVQRGLRRPQDGGVRARHRGPDRGRHRHHEHHAGFGHRTHPRDRDPQGPGCQTRRPSFSSS